ncbi:competence/damage-inducible protein A [Granulicella cerasi]|uniref:CinA-like protein n=1 Tax=Granulicella cerasi TaxID=741063 RepID=A0ABW1ZE46_9BACT|nr:competence/damage-inducible protein A [Granulicella cerasi]
MIAEIIAVGSEMLTPDRQDTNSLYITRGLNGLGVSLAFKGIVGDNRQHLTDAIRIALKRVDVVVLSGGLGPTEDDLTRECSAEALGVELYREPELMVALTRRFAERRMTMSANNERQTEVLDGAVVLDNKNGSAPGQWLDTTVDGHRKILILLPGPPKELMPLFDNECLPRLAASLPQRHLARRTLRMALLPESQVDARCAPIYQRFTDIETTILAGNAEITLNFVCTKPTQEEAEQRVNALTELIEHEMGDSIYSSHGESLEEIVQLMLGLRDMTLSVAESCTGGLLAQRITAVPNASRTFAGGAVVYNAQQKTTLAHVPADLIAEHGTVSEPVARALAEGIREVTGSKIGIGITGIAGPSTLDGADEGKPVGLVYVALADGEDTQVKELNIRGDRDRIRYWTTQHALEMLRLSLQ